MHRGQTHRPRSSSHRSQEHPFNNIYGLMPQLGEVRTLHFTRTINITKVALRRIVLFLEHAMLTEETFPRLQTLLSERLDAWLVYNFRGSNPLRTRSWATVSSARVASSCSSRERESHPPSYPKSTLRPGGHDSTRLSKRPDRSSSLGHDERTANGSFEGFFR
jgi:hypothetical protein